jgi:hypothetical protein
MNKDLNNPIKNVIPRYKRQGECNRCGWCCQLENCKHLKIVDGFATCMIYDDKKKPLKCSLYPANPPIMHEKCGYYFLDLYENNKKVKRIL